MKTSIFMVTFLRDLEFCEYALRSVSKFCSGFEEMVVMVPEQDEAAFLSMAGDIEPMRFPLRIVGFKETPNKGFCHHMALICSADLQCKGDAVLFMDADCMFLEPVTPSDYIHDGKPVLVYQPFEEFKQYVTRYSWKTCVKNAVGIDPEHECMCRHPSVHLAEVLQKTRALIEAKWKMSFLDYILSCKNTYPQTFAEFPTLGAVAWEHFHEAYHWARYPNHNDGSIPQLQREKLKAFWSHGGLEMVNDRHPNETARQNMERILAG